MKRPLTLSRRRLLGATTAAALGGVTLPVHRALAAPGVSGADLKFVFVMNYGGWDITRVFANEFANPNVDMERDAETRTIGDLAWVSHPDRPAVDSFFDAHWSKSVILNGILVSSIAHENCLKIMFTGGVGQDRADWAASLAHPQQLDFALPHIVVYGPNFTGSWSGISTTAGGNGQLEALLSGEIIDWSDTQTRGPSAHAEARMDSYLRRRIQASADAAAYARQSELHDAYLSALDKAGTLKDLLGVVDWSSSTDLSTQIDLATSLLSMGISRTATISSTYGWDTHSLNDATQSSNFDGLFGYLNTLMDKLASLPGTAGGALADETVVVVLSEMGRTPQLNSLDGKDHWPYTSALMVGPRLNGGRVLGTFNEYFYGDDIDLASGETGDGYGEDLSADNVGATLLALADVDPEEYLPGVAPIEAALL